MIKDTSFSCNFNQKSPHLYTFGNAECNISLLDWKVTDNNFLSEYRSFEVVIDTNDRDKLFSLITAIVIEKPILIEIIPYGDSFNTILDDAHMALLHGIHTVGIPKNYNITIDGLRYLLQSTNICISGCTGITGDGLPLVSHSLKYIKTWGWGPYLKCNEEIMSFIDKVNYGSKKVPKS